MAAVHPASSPARSGRVATLAPTRLAAVVGGFVALVLVGLVGLVGAAPVAARPVQDPGSTTVPGFPSTTVAPSTVVPTTASPTTAPLGTEPATTEPVTEPAGSGRRRVADENRKIWAVVAGLVFVALALSVLTIRYWRKTRPVAGSVRPMPPSEAALAIAFASTPDPETPAPSDADVDVAPAASADGPEPGDEVVVPSEPEPAPEPELVPQADLDTEASLDTGTDTAEIPVVDAPLVAPGAARRAVAGADHATADEAWEPRATGEHERVVVAPTNRPTRLSAEQRAALFAQRAARDS